MKIAVSHAPRSGVHTFATHNRTYPDTLASPYEAVTPHSLAIELEHVVLVVSIGCSLEFLGWPECDRELVPPVGGCQSVLVPLADIEHTFLDVLWEVKWAKR